MKSIYEYKVLDIRDDSMSVDVNKLMDERYNRKCYR